MRNQIFNGLFASLLALALTACGGGGELVIRLELPPTDCTDNFFHPDCDADEIARVARQIMCLADANVDDSCIGDDGIATLFCKDNPNHQSPACIMLASVPSTMTSLCGAGLRPFEPFCEEVADIDDIRIQHCLMNGNAVTDTDCAARVVPDNDCVLNPFAASCDTDTSFDEHRLLARIQRFQYCSFSALNPDRTACRGYMACIGTNNPFDENCAYSGFASERNTRITLCTDTPGDTNCTGQNNIGDSTRNIAYCIGTNPFDEACTDDTFGSAFDAARRSFVDDCIDDPMASSCAQMVDTETVMSCITNPFTADCNDPAFNGARVDRITKCGAGTLSGADCTATTSNVTSVVLSLGTRLDSEPDTTNPRNQFLRGTEYNGNDLLGLNVGEALGSNSAAPTVTSFNLATARFANQSLGGNASDGVAFFFGTVNGQPSAYAGILGSTDLGARLTQTSGSAMWSGQFRTIESSPVNTDFTLNITFRPDGGDINAFVQARPNSRLHYLLDGTFNNQGIINGKVTRGNFANDDPTMRLDASDLDRDAFGTGPLQGLIGQEGAVGVFIRDPGFARVPNSPGFNFAGGFVACPLHADGRCENASR